MEVHPVLVWLTLFSLLTSKDILTVTATQESMSVREDKPCPPWLIRNNSTGKCSCGTNSLQGIILCQADPYKLRLYECFCMTYSLKKNLSLVGTCLYTCNGQRDGYYTDIYMNSTSHLTEFMCGSFNRQGQLCGSCMPGYAPPVYSYYLSCVNCTTSNWGKYMAVSLLPVTAFFVFVITFRLNATSPRLNGFILCMQILLCPPSMRLATQVNDIRDETYSQKYVMLTVTSLYSIWNLDFLKLLYTPFCMQPHMNTLQVIALDYIIAVYPLILIVLSYLLVTLYDRNVKIIVWLWKPFVPLLIRFRRQWNIRSSLVDAFATFLLLSYVKILSVSVDLLMPVLVYDQNGHTLPQLYLFNQGDVAFFGSHHLPYACLALFFLLTFTLLPMLLLFLYPCSCFQIYLNRTGFRCQSLHIIMDTFQGHYKDGTNGTRDLRFFSGLYLLLRVVLYISAVVTYQVASYAYTTLIVAIMAFSVALARPYKNNLYTMIDTVFLVILTGLCVTLGPQAFGVPDRVVYSTNPIIIVLLLIPFMYVCLLVLYWLKSWKVISLCLHSLHQKLRSDGRYKCFLNNWNYQSLS